MAPSDKCMELILKTLSGLSCDHPENISYDQLTKKLHLLLPFPVSENEYEINAIAKSLAEGLGTGMTVNELLSLIQKLKNAIDYSTYWD